MISPRRENTVAALRFSDLSAIVGRLANRDMLSRLEDPAQAFADTAVEETEKFFPDSDTGSGHSSASLFGGIRISKAWVGDVIITQAQVKVDVRNLLGARPKGQMLLQGLDTGFRSFTWQQKKDKWTAFDSKKGESGAQFKQFFPPNMLFYHKATVGAGYRRKVADSSRTQQAFLRLRSAITKTLQAELARRNNISLSGDL